MNLRRSLHNDRQCGISFTTTVRVNPKYNYYLPAWEHSTKPCTIKTRVTISSVDIRTICLANSSDIHYNHIYATARYPRVIKNHKTFNEKSAWDWTMKLETFYDEGSSPETYCPNGNITYNIFYLIVFCTLLTTNINKKRHLCVLCRHSMPSSWDIREQKLGSRYQSHVSN